MENELSPEQKAARDELHDLLQRHASLLGPWQETEEMVPPSEAVFLDTWILLAAWTDSNGSGWITRIPAKDIRTYQRVGLLHEGLYGFEDP